MVMKKRARDIRGHRGKSSRIYDPQENLWYSKGKEERPCSFPREKGGFRVRNQFLASVYSGKGHQGKMLTSISREKGVDLQRGLEPTYEREGGRYPTLLVGEKNEHHVVG